MELEHVFKALADHHRRHLLHVLSLRDGQTLSELCDALPISRVGVMKHLKILEVAGLIETQKSGRTRLHFLRPAPLDAVVMWANQYRQMREESYDRLGELLNAQNKTRPVKSARSTNLSEETSQ